jgi:hypothetical protein
MCWCPSLGIFILRERAKLYCRHECPARCNFRCDFSRSDTKHCFLWNVTMTRAESWAQGRKISMPVRGELRIALQHGGWLVCRNGAGLIALVGSALLAVGVDWIEHLAATWLSRAQLYSSCPDYRKFLLGLTLSGQALGCYVTLGHVQLLHVCSNYR